MFKGAFAMHVYALSLEKGGCGKTALAVNIAAAFQQLGLRVLLVDLDSQASATHWLGIDPEALQPDQSVLGVLNDAIQNQATAASVLRRVQNTPEGISLLAAHNLMASLPAQLTSAPLGGLFLLKRLFADLAQAAEAYDIVILDLPPARGPVLAMALAAATRCLVPIQPEDLVMRALQALMTSVEQIHSNEVNPSLQVSIVRNKYVPRSNADRVFDQLLHDHYASQLAQTVFPIRAALRDSAAMQQSVFRYTGTDASEVRGLFLQLVEEAMALDGRG
jgi:chromosome partitioning protein